MSRRMIDDLTDYEIGQRRQIGGVFRSLREAREQTTYELAGSDLKVTQNQVSQVENGRTDMKLSTLQLWAKHFGYSVQMTLVPIDGGDEIRMTGDDLPVPEPRTVDTWNKSREGRASVSAARKKSAENRRKPVEVLGPTVQTGNYANFDGIKSKNLEAAVEALRDLFVRRGITAHAVESKSFGEHNIKVQDFSVPYGESRILNEEFKLFTKEYCRRSTYLLMEG